MEEKECGAHTKAASQLAGALQPHFGRGRGGDRAHHGITFQGGLGTQKATPTRHQCLASLQDDMDLCATSITLGRGHMLGAMRMLWMGLKKPKKNEVI